MEHDNPEINDYIRELMESGEVEEIRVDENGNWTHRGEEFKNKRILQFFKRSVNITDDGEYVIQYGDFIYPIVVEDVPIFVTGVRVTGIGDYEKVFVRLSGGDEEELDPDTLYFRENNSLYCYVKGGRLPSKFGRSPSFQILERLQENEDIYYIVISGKRIVLKEKVD